MDIHVPTMSLVFKGAVQQQFCKRNQLSRLIFIVFCNLCSSSQCGLSSPFALSYKGIFTWGRSQNVFAPNKMQFLFAYQGWAQNALGQKKQENNWTRSVKEGIRKMWSSWINCNPTLSGITQKRRCYLWMPIPYKSAFQFTPSTMGEVLEGK